FVAHFHPKTKTGRMFAHEKLQVYGKALAFNTKAAVWTGTWDKRHSFVDHLSRAAESIVLNLAEAVRQRGAPARLRIVDYSIGSSLECAACLDIARIQDLLSCERCGQEKQQLCGMTKMLIGLRKSWAESIVSEQPGSYRTDFAHDHSEPLFHHERLEEQGLGVIVREVRPEGTRL